jgi:hypothetical protein
MASSGMLRRVARVRTDVSEELSASFIRVTRIGELETTLAVATNRRTLHIPEDVIVHSKYSSQECVPLMSGLHVATLAFELMVRCGQ